MSDYSHRDIVSDRSESASEVENLLVPNRSLVRTNEQGWATTGQAARSNQRGMSFLSLRLGVILISRFSKVFGPPMSKRVTTGFRPAR
jgi:hypothetical protein